MKFIKLYEEFSDYLKVRNFSESTQISYLKNIKVFFSFIEEHYSRINVINQITKDVLTDYQIYLNNYKDRLGKRLSNSTLCNKVVIIKKFFKFLYQNDYIIKNHALYLELPRMEKTLPRDIPTEKEMIQILESCNTRTPISLRNRTILEVFYSTGMRTSELCHLKLQDINLKNQTALIVLGKGGKTRLVPLGQYACFYMEEYLLRGRKYLLRGIQKDEGYLFLSNKGLPFSADTMNDVIKIIMKKIKINKHITSYSFRHAAATHLIKNKVDIKFVGELLGHSNLNTTQRYCHLEIGDLKKMHALFHPREQTKAFDLDNKAEEKNP